jgi:aryl-alcohol dehydrogenase-like predicted oxidoreductase
LGINYFDTAPSYGNGLSETNLGLALKELNAEVYVGTKVGLTLNDRQDIRAGIFNSMDRSLQRLGMDSVDLIQLHNRLRATPDGNQPDLTAEEVLGQVVKAFQDLRTQGKVRYFGLTGLGDTGTLHQVIDAQALDTVQVCYNLLNPSAGNSVPEGYYGQDYGRLIDRAAANGTGVIGIRIMAAGALSGVSDRHPVAIPSVAPIGTGPDYAEDVRRASRFRFMVDDGTVESLVEAALRFVLSKPGLTTALLGLSSLEQLEQAVRWAQKGPLPASALQRVIQEGPG